MMQIETRKITLPLIEAIQGFQAVLPHASTDRITPVINCVAVSRSRLYSSDRYTVGSFEISDELSDGESILVPYEAAGWAARFVTKHLLGFRLQPDSYSLTIEAPEAVLPPTAGKSAASLAELTSEKEKSIVKLSVQSDLVGVEAMRVFKPTFGTFPKVARLFDEFKTAETGTTVALNPAFLERFTGYAKRWNRDRAIQIDLSTNEKTGKPGVVRVTADKFVGLIQPNLILN